MEPYILILLAIMIAAGLLGGAVNHFLSQETNPGQKYLGRSLWVGMAASFMVPLFLNMISSNLIDSIRGNATTPGDKSKLFVFAGFCLVAAISSRAFIRTLPDRVLREAKEAKEQALEAKAEVAEVQSSIEPIVEKETESESPSELVSAAAAEPSLEADEKTVLQVLANGKYALRTLNGIAKETNLEKNKVGQLLHDLGKKSLVAMRLSDKGQRWFITAAGRAAVGGI